MVLHVLVFLLVVCPLLSCAALASRLAPPPTLLLTRRSQAQHTPPSVQAPLPRRLPCLSSRLYCLVEWRASACFCATLARDQKLAGRAQTGEHRGLCLSQPAVRLLRDHRCPSPRTGWGWHAWPRRTHPDLPLSGLPHHLQCSTPHASIPFENSFSSDRHGPVCAGRRAGCFRSRTGLQVPSGHHHHLAHTQGSMRKPCTSTASAPPTGRTPHPAAQR
jgi:hypothetical protein